MLKEKENNEQTNKKCCDNQRTIIHFNWLQQSRQLLADEFFFLILSLSLTGGGGIHWAEAMRNVYQLHGKKVENDEYEEDVNA